MITQRERKGKENMEEKIIAYKGFDKDLKCRGFQYEVGKTYETDKAILCEAGFHACEAPLNVWDYYPPTDGNRFCKVDMSEVSPQRDSDTKRVSKKITVGAEIGIPGLVKAHVEWVKEQTKDCDELSGDAAKIGSSGYAAQIGSSGDAAKIGSSGDDAQIGSSGRYAQIGSSGRYAQIGSSGYDAKIGSSGYDAQIGSSGYDAKIGSSGDAAKIGSSGRYAQIGSSGDDAIVICDADHATVACVGKRGRIKAPIGTWITLAEYGEWDGNGYPCICVKSAQIDGENLKADTFYSLKNGEFVEVD